MSLTGCLNKAGAALSPDDRAAIMRLAAEYRAVGAGALDAGRQAVQQMVDAARADIARLQAEPLAVPPSIPPSIPPKSSVPTTSEAASAEDAAKARSQRLKALGKISDILGPPTASEPDAPYGGAAPAPKLTAEQEQQLLPVLAELLDAAVIDGAKSFQAAASRALADIEAAIGKYAADALTIKHLQGAYISMSSRYADGVVDDMMTVAQFKSKDQLKETPDVPNRQPRVEPDRPDGAAPGVAAPNGDGQRGAEPGDGQARPDPASTGSGNAGGTRVRGGRAPASGARGDPGLFGEEPAISPGDAGREDGQRGDPGGDEGAQPHGVSDADTEEAARGHAADVRERTRLQREAERTPVITGDAENIAATLPILLPLQQKDVEFAEARFAAPDGHGVLFTNGTGTGKAQPLDAKLLTPEGWTTMGKIRVGDSVIAADGTPTRVLGVFPQGDKPIYRVTFSDGAAAECCDEHLWETQTLYARRKARANPSWGCAQPKVRPLFEIRATLDKQHFIPMADPIEFEAQQFKIPPYTLGALLGDGCTRNGVMITTPDREIIARIGEELPVGVSIRERVQPEEKCPAFALVGTQLQQLANGSPAPAFMNDALEEIDLKGKLSHEKFIPQQYLLGSIAQRVEILQGLMDTDGWVDTKAQSAYFSTSSKQLAEGVTFIAQSLGGTATTTTKQPVFTYKGEKREGRTAYSVLLNLPPQFAPFSLPRKAALYRANTKYPPRRKIVDVELVGTKPAQCISVEHPRHLYVTDNCILTHNTFVALGVIKRQVKQGKSNILVVAPNDEVINGWIASAPKLGLTLTKLESKKDAGRGVVITTYANLRDNSALLNRKWDMLAADEAQNLNQNEDGDPTEAYRRFRVLTMHPDSARARTEMRYPDLHKEIVDLETERRAAEKAKDRAKWQVLANRLRPLYDQFSQHVAVSRAEVEAAQGSRPKALFLSATPFSREKSVKWAQGYLFDWNTNFMPQEGRNAADPYQAFMMQHFGYRMRQGKLNEPDGRRVDRGLMQRNFNTWLKNSGALAGRMLEVDADYDRRFIAAQSGLGRRIDQAFAWFYDTKPEDLGDLPVNDTIDTPDGKLLAIRAAMSNVRQGLRNRFDYHSRMRLLEALKAEAAVPYIQGQLDMGRKVVVFHDLIKGQRLDPFGLVFDREKNPTAAAVFDKWQEDFSDLVDFDWASLKSPIETMHAAFGGQVGELNGQNVTKKQRKATLEGFNSDEPGGPMVLVVQSALEAGWSGHDTTGKHPRVLLNLGLPVTPTRSIQQEGRIYRVGQASNAMFRYMNTQTNWEFEAFANTISRRASTAENLAMGEEARGLLASYVESFEETGDYPAGHEGEGTGGKARDRELRTIISDWDRAKTMYWAQQKKTQATKAKEGKDYFATPEPLGLKMVQWGDIRPDETGMEPSAGHGAIARWFPDNTHRIAVEPSPYLAPRLALVFDGSLRQHTFEDLHITNKADVIGMNPPFGVGGKTAIEHLDKAFNDHLNEGGRIVALLPEGPAADARLDKFLNGTHAVPIKPLATIPGIGEVYAGDTMSINVQSTGMPVGNTTPLRVVVGHAVEKGGQWYVWPKGDRESSAVVVRRNLGDAVIRSDGARATQQPNAEGAHVVGTIKLPPGTFVQAGTSVRTRIIIIDKLGKDQEGPARVDYDFSQLDSVEELFDEIESLAMPERTKPRPVEVDDDTPAAAKPDDDGTSDVPKDPVVRAKPQDGRDEREQQGQEIAQALNLPVVEHTTGKGNLLRGVVLRHVNLNQAKAGGDPYAFPKAGGVYVRLYELDKVLKAHPLPPVAREEAAVYAVREPDANYDLFGERPVPAATRGPAAGVKPRQSAVARDQHLEPTSVLSVRAEPNMPGLYRVTSQIVEIGRKSLPVARVANWGDAAAALSSLTSSAVERFDVLITDKAGKPLALVGGFKGKTGEVSAPHSTVLAEALRIEGAAAAWGVHNHPSGIDTLSSGDMGVSQLFGRAFGPSSVRWMGLAAVADNGSDVRFSAVTDDGQHLTGLVYPSKATSTVPIVERTLDVSARRHKALGGPADAKAEVAAMMKADPRPGIIFLDFQNRPQAWVPVDPAEMAALRADGRFDRLINSASNAGAAAAIIANPGGALNQRTLSNIASALHLADVRTLDVIDAVKGRSEAERGLLPSIAVPVLSRTGEEVTVTVRAAELRKAIVHATTLWSTAVGMPRAEVVKTAEDLPEDVKQMLRARRAMNNTRGLLLPDGRVFLVADRIANVEDGLKVLFHEVYGHFGMRAFLGDSYETQMGLLRMANPALAAEANAWYAANGQQEIQALVNNGVEAEMAGRVVRALAVEEALADRADDAPIKGWKSLMARLQKALRSMGLDSVANWLEAMTEAETHALLAAARRVVRGGDVRINLTSPNLAGAASRGPVMSRAPAAAAPPPTPTLKPSSAILDTALRLPMKPIAMVTSGGYTRAIELADRALSVFGDSYEYVKAGVVDQYGLDVEHNEAKQAMKTAIRVNARKTGEVVERLRALDRAQSRVAYLWMSDKTEDAAAARALFDQLPEEPRLVLQSLKADIEHLSDEAVELGLISPEVRERNRMAYLHRSYERYESENTAEKQTRMRAIRILGDQFKGRGMSDYAGMDQVGTKDFWQRKTNGSAHDPSLKGKKFIRFERRELPDTNTPQLFEDENGAPMGRIREVAYWPEDEAVPARFNDWRNDGPWEARYFNKTGKVGMWRDFTLAERTKLGEVQEVKFAVATTMIQMVRDVETARFLDWVARNESVLDESLLPEGAKLVEASTWLTRSYLKKEWVQVPDGKIAGTAVKRYGNLAGRFVPGPVWNDIRQIAELTDQGDLSHAFAESLRMWKLSKTALSPVTHMNNVMSNFMLADLHDVQARHIYVALRAWTTHKKDPAFAQLISDYQDNGGDAGKFNEVEVREELFAPLLEELRKQIEAEAGVKANITAAQVIDLLQHRQFRQAFAALGDTRVARGAAWIPKKMIKLYGVEDEVFRLAAFVKARQDGLNDHDAGKFARDSFLNYDITAPWINAMRRTAWPFIAFSYRAIPMLARTMADKPHKLVKYALLSAGLNALAYVMLGGGDDDEDREERERALMADEKAGKIWGFLTPKLIRMPYNDKNGNPVFLDIRRWIPGGDVVDLGQSKSMLPLPPPLVPGGPLMLFAEFATNSSGLTGQDITMQTDDWDERLGKAADWLWKGIAPNNPVVPGTYSFEGLMNAANGRVAPGPSGQEKTSLTHAALSSVGIKLDSYPIETLDYLETSKARAYTSETARTLRLDMGAIERSGMSDDEKDSERSAKVERAKTKIVKRMEELGAKREKAGLQ